MKREGIICYRNDAGEFERKYEIRKDTKEEDMYDSPAIKELAKYFAAEYMAALAEESA